jgi:hypothetical protein
LLAPVVVECKFEDLQQNADIRDEILREPENIPTEIVQDEDEVIFNVTRTS